MGTLEPGGAPDEPVRPDVRVGNADREAAITVLGTHLEAGRLDIDEYGDRSARASGAVYRGELAELFIDLPAPHPPLPRAVHEEPVHGEAGHGELGPEGPMRERRAASLPSPYGPAPLRRPAVPVFGLVLLLMMLLPMVVLAVGTGGGGGGLIALPLIFLLIGGLRHGLGPRRGHGPWDPGPHGRR